MPKVFAIILAAGSGDRFGHRLPKQFIKVAGKTLLEHTLDIFQNNKLIDEIFLVIHPQYRGLLEEIIIRNSYTKLAKVLSGGASRRHSSYIGIRCVENDDDIILVHDSVRPFVNDRIIDQCVEALQNYDAVDVAIPSSDTIIKVNEKMIINGVPNRKFMYRGQTPQGFKAGIIKKGHILAQDDTDMDITDDCGLVLKYGLADIYVVRGTERNLKITYPEDIYLADRIFQLKTSEVTETTSLEKLKDKNIVIFGSSRGIGKCIMELATRYGANVFGFSQKNNVDVANYEGICSVLENIRRTGKKIDYVVNTAGIMSIGKIESRNYKEIIREINVNYIGSVNVVKACIKYIRETKGSMALFTSSSYTRGRSLYSIYSSTKAAIVNLIQAVAEELVNDGIRVNAINPERTSTPMRWENFGWEPEETLLKPEFVAEKTLRTLLSDLTGQIIDIRL